MSQPPLFEGNAMEYYFAPMEGITGGEFRRVHHRHFFGVDKYPMTAYAPGQPSLMEPAPYCPWLERYTFSSGLPPRETGFSLD